MSHGGARPNSGRKKIKETLVVELYRSKWNNDKLTLRDILYKMYVEDGLVQEQMAKELFMSKTYVSKLLTREGIPRKKLTWTF
jgi:hypothetical protein